MYRTGALKLYPAVVPLATPTVGYLVLTQAFGGKAVSVITLQKTSWIGNERGSQKMGPECRLPGPAGHLSLIAVQGLWLQCLSLTSWNRSR